MANLLVSGDSWTSCWPLEEQLGHRLLGWPNIVATRFGFDLIDTSRAGSSNYRIFRKAFQKILERPTLSIVFLTSYTRFETGVLYGEKPGKIYQHIIQNPASNEAFRKFFNGYKQYSDMLRQIISLQAVSQKYNVQCFFLDTFSKNLFTDLTLNDFNRILTESNQFDYLDDATILKKYKNIKELEHNIDWSLFISKDSYDKLIQGCDLVQSHPVEDGHLKIADIVTQFLQDKGYQLV